jgi:hypothetical protein
MMANQHESARRLVAGGLADFLIYLTSLPDPIVVGGNYPRDRLVQAFQNWAKDRDFSIEKADVSTWREACRKGLMGA